MIELVNQAWYLTKNGSRVRLIGYNGVADEDGDYGVITSQTIGMAVIQAGGACAAHPELSLVKRIDPRIPIESQPVRGRKALRIIIEDPT